MGRLAGSKKRIRNITYSPLPSQRRFHRSTARFKGYSGSIGSGKSAALCHEAIRLTYLNPGRTGLVGAPTYPMLRDATLAALTEILHVNDIRYELNKSEFVITMKDTGSRILLRSLDEFERLRGTNLVITCINRSNGAGVPRAALQLWSTRMAQPFAGTPSQMRQ